MKVVFGILLFLVAIVGLDWVLEYNNLIKFGFFGIRYENTRREIFEQSYSFNRSLANDLVDLRRQYEVTQDPNKRAAIVTAVRSKIAGYDISQLHDPMLESWIGGLP